jgi:hypothetical protein
MTKSRLPYLVTGLILALTAAWLLWLGRVPICTCGYIRLFHAETMSSENSQHISDWYTPSHVMHGIIFYAILWWLFPRMSFGWRLAIATLVESGWEILENSNAIIERYRAVTISLDYYGDSVLNSVMDILAMVLGFWLASRIPIWASVAIIVGFEVLTMIVIRDGLALNILMLIYPLDFILNWQAGA